MPSSILPGSERLYRTLVETSSDLIWAVDLVGRFTFVNRAAARVLGYEPDELIGVSFTDLQPPDVADADAGVFARMLGGEEVHGYETVRLRRDGSRVSLSVSALPFFDDEGRIVGITGTGGM